MELSASSRVLVKNSLTCRNPDCKTPNKIFSYRSDRNRHEREQHRPQQSCTRCSCKFKRSGAFKQHSKKHDKVDEFITQRRQESSTTASGFADIEAIGEFILSQGNYSGSIQGHGIPKLDNIEQTRSASTSSPNTSSFPVAIDTKTKIVPPYSYGQSSLGEQLPMGNLIKAALPQQKISTIYPNAAYHSVPASTSYDSSSGFAGQQSYNTAPTAPPLAYSQFEALYYEDQASGSSAIQQSVMDCQAGISLGLNFPPFDDANRNIPYTWCGGQFCGYCMECSLTMRQV